MKKENVASLRENVEKEGQENQRKLNEVESKLKDLNCNSFEEKSELHFMLYMLGMFGVSCLCFAIPKLPFTAAALAVTAANLAVGTVVVRLCNKAVDKKTDSSIKKMNFKDIVRSMLETEKTKQNLIANEKILEAENNYLLNNNFVNVCASTTNLTAEEAKPYDESNKALIKKNKEEIDEISTEIALKKVLKGYDKKTSKLDDILDSMLKAGLVGIQFMMPMSILSGTHVNMLAFLYPAILAGCSFGAFEVKYGDEKRKLYQKYLKTLSDDYDEEEIPELEIERDQYADEIGLIKMGTEIRNSIMNEKNNDVSSEEPVVEQTLNDDDVPCIIQMLNEQPEELEQEKGKVLSKRK